MATSKDDFVGFRLTKTDDDIKNNLKGFEDRTKRMKEVYRIAMAVERGEYAAKPSEDNNGAEFSRAELVAALVERREPMTVPAGKPSKPFFPVAKAK